MEVEVELMEAAGTAAEGMVVEVELMEAASAAAIDDEGWFRTGDVASISPDGFLMIVDRTKDLVKSGGEWISSIDLENAAMAHPDCLSFSPTLRVGRCYRFFFVLLPSRTTASYGTHSVFRYKAKCS